ncbi:MAG: ribulose-phosphate 3-epimerase [Bdellovibrionales bacterium]
MVQIAASMLGADWLNFGAEIAKGDAAGADRWQIDIADGHFAPTITYGEELVRRCKQASKLPIEIHLMVTNPRAWFKMMADIGVEMVVFHAEAAPDLHETIMACKKHGLKVGVALNHDTDIAVLLPELAHIDQITLMGIITGWSGQKMIPATVDRAAALSKAIKAGGYKIILQVDGGVNMETAPALAKAGVTGVVTSAYLFRATDPAQALQDLRKVFA